jgi:hypothetical protein
MYTIYPSMLEAQQRNMEAAAAMGCNLISTIFAFECIKHSDGRAALADGIGPVTREQMIAEGFITQPTEG